MSKTFDVVWKWWRKGEPTVRKLPAAEENPIDRRDEPLEPSTPWQHVLDAAGIPAQLNYPSTTLGRLLDQTTERFADAVALAYNDRTWTWQELLQLVNRIAGGLANLGVRRRDRVLLTLPNCPEFVAAFFAIQKLGAVVVNAGPLMGLDDLKKVVALTTPHAAIGLDLRASVLAQAGRGGGIEHWIWTSLESYQTTFDRIGYRVKRWYGRNGHANIGSHITLAELIAEAPARPPTIEPDPETIAVLQPTGGTTGMLKLAQLTHRSLLANATQVAVGMGCRAGQERILSVLPMFHVYGLTTCLLNGVLSAAEMILLTRFNAEQTLEAIRRHKPTIFPLVPAICDALSNEIEHGDVPVDRPKELRLCLSGAAPLPRDLAERFTRLTGVEVVEGYGLTEASPVTHANFPGQQRPGSIGVPLPDTRVRVVDLDGSGRDVPRGEPGEMLLSGPQIMTGYFADPDQTQAVLTTDEDGATWLHTGDVVTMDEDGFFTVIDRKKDLIIHSGLKVYPAKVEAVLRKSPLVKDVAVIGRPDHVHTEDVVAFVVPAEIPEDRGLFDADLRALCREHLAPYEVPAVIEITESIPRSPLGKVLKAQLRRMPPKTASDDDEPEPQHPTPTKPRNGQDRKEAA